MKAMSASEVVHCRLLIPLLSELVLRSVLSGFMESLETGKAITVERFLKGLEAGRGYEELLKISKIKREGV